ncbi:MAG: hypothetical protein IJ690_03585 [Clostridia bacterium]|nr:hypothetical protein [Clostridia bacterium]
MDNRVMKRMYTHQHNYIVAVNKDGNEPPKIFMNYSEERLYEDNYAVIKHCDTAEEAKTIYEEFIERNTTFMVLQSDRKAWIKIHYGTEFKAPTGTILKGLFRDNLVAENFLEQLLEKIKTA